MNDSEENIDETLENIPQEDEAEKVNPWRDPISLVTWGFLMTSFTLNFLLLQYILPTIGVCLLYLGFRSMRKGNRWFYAAWILSGIRLLWQMAQLMILATPINSFDKNNMVLGTILVVLQLGLLLAFRIATRTTLYKEGIKPDRDPTLGLIVWTILIGICALSSLANSWIIFIPLIIFYLAMIRSLYKVGDDMGAVADEFIEASVRVGSQLAVWGYLIICFVLVMLCSVFANHTPPAASVQASITESEMRTKLIKLGFPEDVMEDISDADIAQLSDAFHVEYVSEVLNFDQRNTSTQESSNVNRNLLSGNNLQASTVYVELPDNYLYVFVHFMWKNGNAYWQDVFTIEGEKNFELLDGVLLFQKRGTDYTAPISQLKCEEVATNGWFGADVSRPISGTVSYPFASEKQRGYVFYRLQLPSEQYYGGNLFNYMHNSLPFQFPYKQAEDRIRMGLFHNNMKQHYTNFDMKAYREENGS